MRVVLFLLIALLMWRLIPEKGDKSAYEELLLDLASLKEGPIGVPKQRREGVVKEIYSGDRYAKIQATNSELFLIGQKEVVEEMQGVRALFRDEIIRHENNDEHNGEKQKIKTFTADAASFHYKTFTLFGEKVHFSSYQIDGCVIPKSLSLYRPEASGIAEEVEVRFNEEKINFTATNMTLNFDPKSL